MPKHIKILIVVLAAAVYLFWIGWLMRKFYILQKTSQSKQSAPITASKNEGTTLINYMKAQVGIDVFPGFIEQKTDLGNANFLAQLKNMTKRENNILVSLAGQSGYTPTITGDYIFMPINSVYWMRIRSGKKLYPDTKDQIDKKLNYEDAVEFLTSSTNKIVSVIVYKDPIKYAGVVDEGIVKCNQSFINYLYENNSRPKCLPVISQILIYE